MKTTLVAISALVLSTLSAAAYADSACGPVQAKCAPLIVDAGACSPEAGADHEVCGAGKGKCEVVPESCEGAGESRCVGPREYTYPTTCDDGSGCNMCSIALQPSRAALPSFLLSVGAAAMLLERRRRNPRGQ